MYETKRELHETRQEVQELDGDYLLDDFRDEVGCMMEQAIDELDVYTKEEVDERFNEVHERCEGLIKLETEYMVDQAVDDLNVYTKDEADQRLHEVQEHCEGVNNLETEDMVLGAKCSLEEDVRDEIEGAKMDLRVWCQEGVRAKMRGMARMVESRFQSVEGRVMRALRVGMRRLAQRRRCPKGYGLASFGGGGIPPSA